MLEQFPRQSGEFARTIKQIWNTIKGLEDKNVGLVKDELFYQLIEDWS
jgi:hypothetical protein